MKIFVKILLSIFLLVYLLVLSKLILFKYLPVQEIINYFTFKYDYSIYWHSHNFIPFKTIIFYSFLATDINFNMRLENLLGNIIAFIPFGFIIPLLSKKFQGFISVGIATLCLSLTFELIQLIFGFGSFDVDDLILNTLGGILGYVPIHFFYYLYRRRKDKIVRGIA